MSYTAIYEEMLKIGACRDVAEVALYLSRGIRNILGGAACGVFLLDRGNEYLHLSAYDADARVSIKNKSISANSLDDPLCFSLRTGIICSIYIYRGLEQSPSADSVMSEDPDAISWVCAMPLVATPNKTLGGILLAGAGSKPQVGSEVSAYCLFGAAILQNMILRSSTRDHIASLENDVNSLKKKTVESKRKSANDLIGQSETMREVVSRMEQIAFSSAAVLIAGETGTGKSMAAKLIHEKSPRAVAPYTEINCGAMPANLLESELFGHVKGAFTGAAADHPGLFLSTDKGTIFLDEISELPLNLQSKLLHVLQEKTIRPVGGIQATEVDVRIVSASNTDLLKAVEDGRFRRDLYHRISTVELRMPSLSERIDDIPLLASHFLQCFKEQYERPRLSIGPEAMQCLLADEYPGNVRELAGRIEAAVLLCKLDITRLEPEHLRPQSGELPVRLSLQEHLDRQEALLIKSTLEMYDGNIQKCAGALGVGMRTLYRKIGSYQIKKPVESDGGMPIENNCEA